MRYVVDVNEEQDYILRVLAAAQEDDIPTVIGKCIMSHLMGVRCLEEEHPDAPFWDKVKHHSSSRIAGGSNE